MDFLIGFVFIAAIAFGLGIITGEIAKKKGHDFFSWWLFGALLFIVALPCALMLQRRGDAKQPGGSDEAMPRQSTDTITQLERLNNLREQGAIDDTEYKQLKQETLAESRA